MQFFAQKIVIDDYGKATNFRLCSLEYPHMRALHLAWISFMFAFMSWYSIPPLIDYIAADLNISSVDVFNSNVVAVVATIISLLFVGPLCERYGPRRMMSAILICGSVPCAMTGLINNTAGLIGVRLMIGVFGAAFVPCQFWTTQMFSSSVLGTANAISAGWGNMGAGITYLLMPAIFSGIHRRVPTHTACRVIFVFPASLSILAAVVDLLFATDTPYGDWLRIRHNKPLEKPGNISSSISTDENNKGEQGKTGGTATKLRVADNGESIGEVMKSELAFDSLISFSKVLVNPNVLISACYYGCSLGMELAINNVIGQVFEKKFALDPSTASYLGSIFGLFNVCSRFSGGLFSDFLSHRFHLPGRILAQLIGMTLEGAFLIGFSFCLTSVKGSIILMIFFSFFVQFVCGTTFSIVPFIEPANNGKVMGIVGAGGNLGGLVFNLVFRGFDGKFGPAFLCLGCIAFSVGIVGSALIRVQGRSIWHLLGKTPSP